nr:RNA-directed DNA polymerase, eukaryota, reverse transcriptase zinc-binding domain protein [Tanacetum cinerariifolium]
MPWIPIRIVKLVCCEWGLGWELGMKDTTCGRALDDISALNTVIGNLTLSNDVAYSDSWTRSMDGSGKFTVRTLVNYIQNLTLADYDLGEHHVWNSWIPRKVNTCVWRASLNRLPTRTKLLNHGINIPFILCPLDIALGSITSHGCPCLRKVMSGVFKCALWMIWKWRNKVVNSTSDGVESAKEEDIYPSIQRLSNTWISAHYSLKPISWSYWITNPFNLFL